MVKNHHPSLAFSVLRTALDSKSKVFGDSFAVLRANLNHLHTISEPSNADHQELLIDPEDADNQPTKPVNGKRCNTCCVEFASVADQRAHFKTDWHRLNLQLSLKGKPLLTEEEAEARFLEELQGDQQDCDSLSGSGSEESEDDDQDSDEHAQLVKEGANVEIRLTDDLVMTCWSATVGSKTDLDAYVAKLAQSQPRKWAIFLYSAGHFAGAVFHDDKVVRSKTFHRYVVRQKQGGAQSKNDNRKGNAKSAGASIRRYNERMMNTEIRELIIEWKDDLDACDRFFVSASKQNRNVLFQEPTILSGKDERLTNVPFPVKRPTNNEVKRTLQRLCLAKIQRYVEPVAETSSPSDQTQAPAPAPAPPLGEEHLQAADQEDEPLADEPIHILCKTLETQDLSESSVKAFLQESQDVDLDGIGADGETPLHLAASRGHAAAVLELLQNGADPTVRDTRGRTSYNSSSTKKVRDAFRVFRGLQPDKWDYELGGIPEAITSAGEEAKRQKQREKKKRQAAKRKKEKERKTRLQEAQRKEKEEQDRLALECAVKCAMCAKPLIGSPSDFFYRMDYGYCSSECMQKHRRVLAAEAAERRMKGGT